MADGGLRSQMPLGARCTLNQAQDSVHVDVTSCGRAEGVGGAQSSAARYERRKRTDVAHPQVVVKLRSVEDGSRP